MAERNFNIYYYKVIRVFKNNGKEMVTHLAMLSTVK